MTTASRTHTLVCLLALVAITLIPQSAFAQRVMWPDGPKDLHQGWFQTAIPDCAGGAVFAMARPAGDYSNEQVLQRVDNTGTKLWGNGVVIPELEPAADYCLAGDAQSGFYVLGATEVASYDYSIWIRRLDRNGRILWIQTLTRMPSCQYLMGAKPTVLADRSTVVLFMNYSSSGSQEFTMQRIASNGRRLYGDSGVVIGKGLPGEYPMACAVDSKGSVYGAWR